ncbi:ABC transporter [Cercophora scortea]|uniref:ABC transporter n=1 Tax=Cercophora scortea TaxID=314031 RepID=A0AAE0I7L8_9PEZI|nr:ABC transporter [Cercophora scortea]
MMASCPPGSDRLFGPRVSTDCRAFDFTLQFEDILFACLPAALFLLLSSAYAILLVTKPVVFAFNSKLVASKLVTLTSLFAVQLAFLALRVQEHPASSGSASIAADVLVSIASLAACGLSILSRRRSPRPPTILSLYLSASVLLGIARTRTLWLLAEIPGRPHASAILMTVVLALSTAALVLDSVGHGPSRETAKLNTPPIKDYKSGSPEQYSAFWPRTTFTWLASTFRRGYARIISLDDLPPLDTRIESDKMRKQLQLTWSKYDHRARHSLLRASFHSYLPSFLSAIIPRLCLTGFTFSQPFLINVTLNLVDRSDPERDYGNGLIGAWALVYLGLAVSNSIYQYQNFRFVTRLRGGLIALIYERTLQTRTADLGDITAVSVMGTDVERIVSGLQSIHEIWGSFLEIGIACWLLERQLFLACLAPILIVLVFVAITSKLSANFGNLQRQWIEKVQERLRVTSAMLGDMKAIKMLGLSRAVLPVIQGLRLDEINTSRAFRSRLVTVISLSLAPINLAPMFTFAIYIIIAVFWKNETLLTAQAFTSLSLVTLLTTPVIMFIQNLPSVVQCVGNFDRIQEFCNYDAEPTRHEDNEADISQSPSVSDEGLQLKSLVSGHITPTQDPSFAKQKDAIQLKRQHFSWAKTDPTPILRDISIKIKRGSVMAVIGPIGSGKTSFLNALLGEMVPIKATPAGQYTEDVQHRQPGDGEPIAYCGQQPWLENGTIRQNIVGASPWDDKWYTSVRFACCLDQDLGHLKKGDQTRVGSKGVNLSGGQKQRIALARAVYSRHSIVILDDVFSGMDAHTSETVFGRLLGREEGLLRNQNTTVVLTTHSHKIMTLVDEIVVLQDGRIVDIGSPRTLLQNDSAYLKKLGISITEAPDSKKSQDEITAEQSFSDEKQAAKIAAETSIEEASSDSATDNTEATEARLLGGMRRKNGELSVYKYYLHSSGYVPVLLYTLTMVLWIFCTEFSTIWVSWWSAANAEQPNQRVGMYMGTHAMLGVIGSFSVVGAAWFAYISIISNSANKLHLDLLTATLRAPFRLFTSTDNGELLNRFGEDMELIDMDLPGTALNYTSTAVSCLAQVIILAIFSRSLGIAVPFIFALLYLLQRFYLQTSRQMRLLMIEAKAPLYTHFSETESSTAAASGGGAVTIRAFGWQRFYQARASRLVDQSQRPAYLQSCIQHWLAFVLNLLMAVLAVVLVATVVTWRNSLDISAGGVGVSLIIIIGLSETLTRLIRTWTKLESSVGAVARVKRFVADTGVEDDGDGVLGGVDAGGFGSGAGGLGAGAVEFEGVVASYTPEAEPVLKGISLSVQAGKHVAICGRSGSGKTSLVLCLLRMMDMREGRITLDGVEVAASTSVVTHPLSAEEVRPRINVVPQDPFLLPGTTVRFNLNMASGSNAASDEEMIAALQRVGIWDVVKDQGGLDKNVDALSLSAGQKQLMCFARAMLRRGGCEVLVLDEATSSLDSEAEAVVQDIINSEFRDCTVLAVMHRLKHVMAYDQVALMDAGSLVEFDEPGALMAGETRFAQLYRSYGA